MKNLTDECGSEDLSPWNFTTQDFGQCFFQLFLQLPIFMLLTISSAYYVGKRRLIYSYFGEWNSCQTGIIYARAVIVSILALVSLFELMIRFGVFSHHLGFVEVSIVAVKTCSWVVHLIYITRLKRGNSFNTRGPKPILLIWFLSAVVSALEFRTRYSISHGWPYHKTSSTLGSSFRRPFQFYAFYIKSRLNEDMEDDNARARSYWLGSSGFEVLLQGLYLLTLIPGSTHLEPRHHRHRSRVRDIVYNAYESQEGNYFAGFDEEDETDELPLGAAKENANIISKLLFLWVTPLMKKGACGFIKSCDSLFDLPAIMSTENVATKFHNWTINRSYSLIKGLHVCFGLEFYSIGILKLVSDAMGFCGPVLLNYLVTFIENGNSDAVQKIWVGYVYVAGLFGAALIGALCNTHFNLLMAEVNLKIRAALITTVYRKTVHMRKTTVEKFSSGEIINFMSTDTDRIVNFCPSFHAFWSLPLQVAVTLYLLYVQIGIAFLAGLIFAILLIPINRLLANKIGDLSTKMMKFKDQRVKLMSEILYGVRVLKFHGWESFFSQRVNAIRKLELNSLKGRKYLDALCVYFWATTPVLVSVLSFGTYVLLGNQLTAARVFTSIALFNMLISPLNALPWVINGVVEAWVSIKRVNVLLQGEETKPQDVYTPIVDELKDTYEIVVDNATFEWEREGSKIEQVNLKIKKGQFIGIIGEVGSGKSSLLLALLGELTRSQGTIGVSNINKGVGVVLQEAWIQRGTIRSNICFAPVTNTSKYKLVVENCCLNQDLDSFKSRDETIVGENGLTLSGGQKIRLNLARAVYQDYDLYLLDDIFSAVDFKVAKHLYNKCVMGSLKNKTRIICTHHVRFLLNSDWILVVKQGKIIEQGEPKDILSQYLEEELYDNDMSLNQSVADSSQSSLKLRRSLSSTSIQSNPENSSTVSPGMSKSSRSFDFTQQPNDNDINEEHRQEGTISLHVYKSYWESVGKYLCWLILLTLTAMQATRNISDLWLAHWVSETTTNSTEPPPSTTPLPSPTFENIFSTPKMIPVNDKDYRYNTFSPLETVILSDNDLKSTPETNDYIWIIDGFADSIPLLRDLDRDVKYYFIVFILIGIANSFFTLARAFLFAYGGIRGATKIHISLINSVLRAKMIFFDTTPIGRIINRFSTDVATVDDSLPFISNILLAQLFGLMGTLIVTCYAIPWILVIVIPLLLVCNNIQEYYRHTARELRRLGSISLSPVYAHFSETLKGLVTIRAMRAVRKFEETNEAYLEANQKCQYSTQAVSQWLSFRLQMVGVLVISGVGLVGIFQHHFGTADPGIIGLAISYALTVTNSLSGFVQFLTETEKEMVAVERACEYIEEVEEESHTETIITLPYFWPAQGVVLFRNVSLKYREDHPYVLKNVSFETRPSEKIGVVGRTGSGKSSLFTALFRLVDQFEGDIVIDTVNTKHLSLTDLRSKLCIIPQDPLIFSGTLRENLDPKGGSTDEGILRALEKCQLQSLVRQLGGLNGDVGESGNFLSTGQKQLVCLARAILVNAKILCIDEATANVDQETDKVIQSTLRTCFGQTTVITVAHRINTIFHCNRVLVMSNGEVMEFEDPDKLMQRKDSYFYQLAHGTF